MKTATIHLALAAVAIMSIAGCGSVLAPQPDRSRFFVLTAANGGSPKSTAAALSSSRLSVGVGPVQIPDYLQRPGIATRVGPTQVRYSQVNRWAEPLEECFPRVLAQNLSRSLPKGQVILFPWPGNIHVDYQVQVNVERFELTSQGQAVLAARWLIKDPQTEEILASGDANETHPAGTDAATGTAALSQTLAAMADSQTLRISQLSREAHHTHRKGSARSPAFPPLKSDAAHTHRPPPGF